jgi:hypothetical protein
MRFRAFGSFIADEACKESAGGIDGKLRGKFLTVEPVARLRGGIHHNPEENSLAPKSRRRIQEPRYEQVRDEPRCRQTRTFDPATHYSFGAPGVVRVPGF